MQFINSERGFLEVTSQVSAIRLMEAPNFSAKFFTAIFQGFGPESSTDVDR
jgi:hypothetical protein